MKAAPGPGWRRAFAAGVGCGVVAVSGCLATAWAWAQQPWRDPLQVAPAHYTVRFENDRLRVLEGVDQPGERIAMHDHPDTLMVALSPFRRRLVLANGREILTESQPGDVRWMPAQSHAGENIGSTMTRALFIEFKAPPR